MTYETTVLEITTAEGVTIPLSYTRHDDNPRGLVVILPGRGYLLEHPVLHYLAKMAMETGYDVLGVPYSFQITRTTALPPMDKLARDCALALDTALAQRNYDRIILAGKSLGTPLAARLGDHLQTIEVRYILLTPVMDSTDYVGDHPTIAIIGTDDAAYDERKISADAARPYLRWHVFDDLNHALEFKTGWDASVAAMGNIIAACETFLKQS
jgi:acetyl esterase/lipase